MPNSLDKASATLLAEHQQTIWTRTDQMMAGLLAAEWVGGVVFALVRSPRTYAGATSSTHPHVWAAIVLGGLIASLPIALARRNPGAIITRHVVAAAQMLMSALLIHIGDGRVEMHFQIFGSLAFIAFYRDWRVLVTASAVTAADHLVGGLVAPTSIYGVTSASLWVTFEHAFWVVFEDVFLIAACVQGVREMGDIARSRAMLEQSYREVEQKVADRTAELKTTQQELLKAARSAGMAEIATSVLHNVGNVLNSVNVSATVVADKIKSSEVGTLGQVGQLIADHKPDLAEFLTVDERGKMVPDFITDLAKCLGDEQTAVLAELESLTKGVNHIKQIVAAQQSMAKKSTVRSTTKPADVAESALSLQKPSSTDKIEFVRDYADLPPVEIDQHKVLQILVNLVSNARHAVVSARPDGRRVTIAVTGSENSVKFVVADNGVGIPAENLSRIFGHGFTTKTDGHGFGLHAAANAAREMGGRLSVTSEGPGKGASFTLEIPTALEVASCPN